MPDEKTAVSISSHYGWSGLMERIEQELRQHGLDPERVTVDELAPIDNYHWHRLAGTLVLARLAAITGADRVLDVGGGIGGPARQLAYRFGCKVTVLDLTPEYCSVGETLTRWTGLSDHVTFVCANALGMTFPDSSFDVVWTQHASMNISNKPDLFNEIARVLRRGGRLALFDVMAGPNQPIHFPVPWAADQSMSFMLAPEEMRAIIIAAGFRETGWIIGEELEAELDRSSTSADDRATVELDPYLLNGPGGPLMAASMKRNAAEHRIRFCMAVFERL